MPVAEEDLNTAMIVRVAVDREGEVFLAIPAGFAGIGRYDGMRVKYLVAQTFFGATVYRQ